MGEPIRRISDSSTNDAPYPPTTTPYQTGVFSAAFNDSDAATSDTMADASSAQYLLLTVRRTIGDRD